jgi:hypothetical protein
MSTPISVIKPDSDLRDVPRKATQAALELWKAIKRRPAAKTAEPRTAEAGFRFR